VEADEDGQGRVRPAQKGEIGGGALGRGRLSEAAGVVRRECECERVG
jgi:hypothetical protein